MREDEDVLDDFPVRDPISPAWYMVGAYRAEHTKDWSAINEITPKFPPSYNGTTSSFKYEELIEVWLGVTVLDASKQRPALKNRLHGNAEK